MNEVPGYTLKLLRIHAGWSQGHLADRIGVTRGTVAQGESVGRAPRGASPALIQKYVELCPPFAKLEAEPTQVLIRDLALLLRPEALLQTQPSPPAKKWQALASAPLSGADIESALAALGVQHTESMRDIDGSLMHGFAIAAAWYVVELSEILSLPESVDWAARCRTLHTYILAHPAILTDQHQQEPPKVDARRGQSHHPSLPTSIGELASEPLTPDNVAKILSIWSVLSLRDRELWVELGARLAGDISD
ncbi:MAG: hypothetical protein C7B46_19850 [Sulfobacillus benefaciens]|uniref:HTH cro/C1-type domain-containing protein n=1 Tax=Sulfobacillus benefaciens TaxID=453960 RepID=A0A2T2WWI1_9FIRM|nr:MAG: hypothetical protein C7B46_19850 [Sulfobacillus benefaciens]